jgi:ABC-type nitrate/sulfonate/bicarbonate transport system substrate-binding protein
MNWAKGSFSKSPEVLGFDPGSCHASSSSSMARILAEPLQRSRPARRRCARRGRRQDQDGLPGPVTTFSLPYLVAQKKGWLEGLEVEDVHVTGDANAMRVLLSGNADIGLIGTLNVLASIHAGAGIRAVHSWQPIGDYNLVLATGKGSKLADLAGKTFASSGPGGLPDQLPRLIMRKHGIDEATARFVQVGGHAARLQAVIGGRADATLVNTVTALKGVQDGKVTVLTRLSTEFPGLGYVWNVVRAESLGKPELAAAFQTMTDIGIRGSRHVMENPDEAAAILHERLPDLDLAFLKAVVRDLNSESGRRTRSGDRAIHRRS